MEHQNNPFEAAQNTTPESAAPNEQQKGIASDVEQIRPNTYEAQAGNSIERQVAYTVEANNAPAAPQLPAVQIPAPSGTVPPVDGAGVANAASDTPVVAADVDLIEREWVNKVKDVISATRDDPYKREQEVKNLQVEYIRKRYGREIGKSND